MLDSSGSFTSFVSEFKTWQPPSEEIDPNSFVFAAAEILRFLRDMALEVSTTQSKSLIQNQQRDKSFFGSPPTTPAVHLRGTPSSHLVHTGAVLCMLDLLPAITFDPFQYPGANTEREESSSLGSQDSAIAEQSLMDDGGHDVEERGSVTSENDVVDGLSVSRLTEGICSSEGACVSVENVKKDDRMVWAGELAREKDKVREEKEEQTVWETEYCKMSAEEAHKVCMYICTYLYTFIGSVLEDKSWGLS